MEIQFKLLDKDMPKPSRPHSGDGALDLRTTLDFTLMPGERLGVPTGLALAIPEGYGGFVIPRSGLAARHGVSVVNAPGLVDAGYRGEVVVILVNLGSEPVSFRRGDRIAQIAIMPVDLSPWTEVETLPQSSRGTGGFGSSGLQ